MCRITSALVLILFWEVFAGSSQRKTILARMGNSQICFWIRGHGLNRRRITALNAAPHVHFVLLGVVGYSM
jgi:hypothetical protein